MEKQLRILILDDTPTDAELMEYELRKGGIVFTAQHVENRETFARALAEFHPDIILADYKLPGFDGLSALKMARSISPQIPMIFVTGALMDTEAVELIHAGAKDYVLKDRLARLASAVQHVLMEKRAEEALKERDAFIRNILDTVDESFMVVDLQYRILAANRAFCNAVGLPEERVLGRYCYEVTHDVREPCCKAGRDCAVSRTLSSGKSHMVSHIHVHNNEKHYMDIRSYPFPDASGNITGVIVTMTDMSEMKKLEEQLRHAQKLESLGTLAGGIAHDFNNILNVIVGYGNILELELPLEDPNMAHVKEILAAAKRATQLTQALLIFGRKQTSEIKPLNLNELVIGMREMLLRLIRENIEIKIDLTPELLHVMGDYRQLESMMMNFVTNAGDAMPAGGSLTIETRTCVIDEEFSHRHGFGEPGKYALLSVADTGVGMDEETREKIFEPFFTTKKVGKGTGLGLAIVYGIVKQHKGHINCYSEPGRGTVFKAYLPLIEATASTAGKVVESAIAPGGNETIMIVDDDTHIRKFTRTLLEKYGYTVLEAKDGNEAVRIYRDNRDTIALTLLDAIMPKKSGLEAFKEMREIEPKVKVIFVSGYNEDLLDMKNNLGEERELLQKPVKSLELLAKVRELLDAT